MEKYVVQGIFSPWCAQIKLNALVIVRHAPIGTLESVGHCLHNKWGPLFYRRNFRRVTAVCLSFHVLLFLSKKRSNFGLC